MLFSVNGIGTAYRREDDLHARLGYCGSCSRLVELRSYETEIWVTFLYLPLFRVGRTRILQKCPACRAFMRIDSARYFETRQAAITKALSSWHTGPEAAIELLRALILFRAADTLYAVGDQIEARFRKDCGVLSALGVAYEGCGRMADAHRCQSKALDMAEIPADKALCTDQLARVMLQMGMVRDADTLLKPIIRQRLEDRVPMIALLVEAYQAKGMHGEALSVLSDLTAAFPGLESDVGVRTAQDISKQHFDAKEPVRSHALTSGRAMRLRAAPESVVFRVIWALVLSASIIWLAAAYLAGRNRTVYVVNAMDRPYLVKIAGQLMTLDAQAARTMELPEGEIPIQIGGMDVKVDPMVCRLSTPLLTRPFRRYTLVINPDRSGEFVLEKKEGEELHRQMSAGKLVHALDAVDLPFEPWPKDAEPGRSSQPRSRLGLNRGARPSEIALRLARRESVEAGKQYLLSYLEFRPDDGPACLRLQSLMDDDELQALAKLKVAIRPPMLHWHRVYQDVVRRRNPQYDLHAEYAKLLAEDPANTALMYLLGRVAANRTEEQQLYRRAAEGKPPVPYGYSALAWDAMSQGRFDDALANAKTAAALAPTDEQLCELEDDALEAAGQFGALVERVRQRRIENNTWSMVLREAYYSTRTGQPQAALDCGELFLTQRSRPPQEIQYCRQELRAMMAYAMGNPVPSELLWQKYEDDQAGRFAAAVSAGRASAAETVLGEQPSVEQALLLYICARRAEDDTVAARALTTAVALLSKDEPDYRVLAKWLQGPEACSPKLACEADWPVAFKRIALAALAVRYPQHHGEYAALGSKLNYQRQYPQLALKAVFDVRPLPEGQAPGP